MDRLDFSEAIDYLASRTNLDTDSWQEGQGVTALTNFTVAGAKGALLQDIRDTLDRALAEGEDLQGFLKRFSLLQDRWVGANAWRGTLIWETNIRQAYGAGRLEQLNEVIDSRPYWEWRHGNSPEPRPEHIAMDRKIYRASDVDIALPYGWGCRCQWFSLSEREFLRSGRQLSTWVRPPLEKGWNDRRNIEKRIAELRIDKELKEKIRGATGGNI